MANRSQPNTWVRVVVIVVVLGMLLAFGVSLALSASSG
jgi:hypothetical protein